MDGIWFEELFRTGDFLDENRYGSKDCFKNRSSKNDGGVLF